MPKTVFFDLDGTLIDSVPDVHLCLSEVMEQAGRDRLSLALYIANPSRLTKPFPGAVELLTELRSQPITLAICTNKPRATTDPVLAALDLEDYFQMVCCGNEVPHQKPDGRHIEHMVAHFGLNADDVVMIGDSHNDLEAADAENVRSIMVSFGYDANIQVHPALDILIDSLTEVPEKLSEIWPA